MQADIDSFLISKAFAKTIYMVKQNHPVQTWSGNHYLSSTKYSAYRWEENGPTDFRTKSTFSLEINEVWIILEIVWKLLKN